MWGGVESGAGKRGGGGSPTDGPRLCVVLRWQATPAVIQSWPPSGQAAAPALTALKSGNATIRTWAGHRDLLRATAAGGQVLAKDEASDGAEALGQRIPHVLALHRYLCHEVGRVAPHLCRVGAAQQPQPAFLLPHSPQQLQRWGEVARTLVTSGCEQQQRPGKTIACAAPEPHLVLRLLTLDVHLPPVVHCSRCSAGMASVIKDEGEVACSTWCGGPASGGRRVAVAVPAAGEAHQMARGQARRARPTTPPIVPRVVVTAELTIARGTMVKRLFHQ